MAARSVWPIAIIGSGPAAYTAALYCCRAGFMPILIQGREPGGQLMNTTYVENWPGTKRILGPELMLAMREQVAAYNTHILPGEVTKIDFSASPFKLFTDKQVIESSSVIIATGSYPKRLNCPGEQDYWGRGVSSCVTCDGILYKNKKVVVVGGGDSAMEAASYLSKFAKAITIVHILDKLTASAHMQARIINNPIINVIYNSTVTEIAGDNAHVTAITVKNKKTEQEQILSTDGVFIAIGLTPNTSLFKDQLQLDKHGYIILTHHTETSVPGIFAAGDVADFRYRQAITASASGCMAALDALEYLKK